MGYLWNYNIYCMWIYEIFNYGIDLLLFIFVVRLPLGESMTWKMAGCPWGKTTFEARAMLAGGWQLSPIREANITGIIEGSFEVKLPTRWTGTDEKQSRAEAERREKIRREKSRRERVRRKKMQMREKVGKSQKTVFFQWFEALEGRKEGSLKRRVLSQLARWEMKNCTPLWREAHFQVKMIQNVQNTSASDHFWKLQCRKSARRCGAKHISKSKCTKHTRLGHFWKLRCRKNARRCGEKHISKSKC